MIHEVEGDILLTQADVIAHGVAASDPMKQGLALNLHERYPSMHKDFHHWCHQNNPKPGEAWVWGVLDWSQVKPLIHSQLGDLDIPVYVYVAFKKGVKAVESSG